MSNPRRPRFWMKTDLPVLVVGVLTLAVMIIR